MQDEQRIELQERLFAALESGAPESIGEVVRGLHPADTAHLIEGIPREQRATICAHLPPEQLGETLSELSEEVRTGLINELSPEVLVAAARTLDIDDLADLVPDLPDAVIADVLFAVDKEARAGLDAVLAYPEDTAGGLMNVDAVTVRANVPVAVVLRYLRLLGELPEYTDKLFVVDRNNRLRGTIDLTALLTSAAADRVREHMDRNPVSFVAELPQEEVAAAFERYNLVSAPVVNSEGRLLGRITVDDVIDVIRGEADQSVLARAGLGEDQDIFAPVLRTLRRRALWLGVNLGTVMIAAFVISRFEDTIEQIVALAVLMPIVASMGGNAGMQTLTMVIRGLGVGTITRLNARLVLRKEVLVGSANGLIWAACVAGVAIFWYQNVWLGLFVALAMVINLITGATAGVLIPLLLTRLGIDPPLASGVTLTAITDIVGFLAVLGLATLFLL